VARYRSSASISPSDNFPQDKTFIDVDVNDWVWSPAVPSILSKIRASAANIADIRRLKTSP